MSFAENAFKIFSEAGGRQAAERSKDEKQMSCTKEIFTEIAAIYPIRADELQIAVPFNVRRHEVSASDLGLSDVEQWLSSRFRYAATCPCGSAEWIEIDPENTSVKSTSVWSRGGLTYDVELNIQINDGHLCPESRDLRLLDHPYHYLVQLLSGEYLFIRHSGSGGNTTAETAVGNQASVKLKIKLPCFNGVQPLV